MGAVIGIGLQTKLTIAFYVLALLAGLLLSASRKLLFNRWLVFGGLIALAIISPYLVWQAGHGFPVVEYTANYSSGKTFQATPMEFLLQQVITMNPLALPLWLGGLCLLLFTRAAKPYRAFGWAYCVPVRVLHAAEGQVLLALANLSISFRGGRVWPAIAGREATAGGMAAADVRGDPGHSRPPAGAIHAADPRTAGLTSA